jgi:hypothetical protein
MVRLGQFPAIARSSQDEDFRVVDEPVGDGGRHGRRIEDFAPVRKGYVGGNHGRFEVMPSTDDLEEQVRALLAQGHVAEFVAHQELGGLRILEFFEQRAVSFRGNEMVDHIDGGGKEDLDVGIARGIGAAFGQEGLARPRVANEHAIQVGAGKVEVEQVADTRFLLLARLVVAAVELGNGEFVGEFGLAPSPGNGVMKTLLEFHVGAAAESREEIEIVLCGVLHDGAEVLGHALQA